MCTCAVGIPGGKRHEIFPGPGSFFTTNYLTYSIYSTAVYCIYLHVRPKAAVSLPKYANIYFYAFFCFICIYFPPISLIFHLAYLLLPFLLFVPFSYVPT